MRIFSLLTAVLTLFVFSSSALALEKLPTLKKVKVAKDHSSYEVTLPKTPLPQELFLVEEIFNAEKRRVLYSSSPVDEKTVAFRFSLNLDELTLSGSGTYVLKLSLCSEQGDLENGVPADKCGKAVQKKLKHRKKGK